MNDVNYNLSIGTNWTLDKFIVSSFADYKARASRTDSREKKMFYEGLFHYFSIIFIFENI